MIFSTSELMQIYKDYSDAKGKIRRLVRKGDLIPIIKGIYEDNPKVDPSYLAPWIYSPSYLSFGYALYIYGTCADCAAAEKKKKEPSNNQ